MVLIDDDVVHKRIQLEKKQKMLSPTESVSLLAQEKVVERLNVKYVPYDSIVSKQYRATVVVIYKGSGVRLCVARPFRTSASPLHAFPSTRVLGCSALLPQSTPNIFSHRCTA